MRWLVFFAIVTLIQGGVDAYALWHWSRWVRRHGWSPWLYRLAWGIGAVMLVLGAVFWAYRRWEQPQLTPIAGVFYAALTLWYLPKLLLLPVLALGDLVALLKRWGQRRRQSLETTQPEPVRRQLLSVVGLGVAVLPFVSVANGMARTTYRPRLFTVEVPIAGLPPELDGLRIVQLSDFHAGSFTSDRFFWEVVERVESLQPALIVLTGDYVNFHPDELRLLRAPLRQMRAPLGVYGCLGNHDHYMTAAQHRHLRSYLESAGVDLLVNDNRRLQIGTARLWLAGTDNTGTGQRFADLERALAGVSATELVLLLFHDPRFWEWEVEGKAPVTLGLCGHTHGGQLGVRIAGVEWGLARLVYRYWAGLYRTGEQWLYVNRGLGFVGPAVRIGIPPEITLLTLRRA
jgi:hypothetical protein